VPFVVVSPCYEEQDHLGLDAVALVREHARGKARSVIVQAEGRPILSVDTTVVLDGRTYGKPADATEAAAMLEALAGRTHEVVSGLCLLTEMWEELHHEATRVTFRPLVPREIAWYVATGEWRDRAGAYAIQDRGAALVRRIEGDYLNVVGLPAALLIDLLARRFPVTYGFG
jgi:septum formation protein